MARACFLLSAAYFFVAGGYANQERWTHMGLWLFGGLVFYFVARITQTSQQLRKDTENILKGHY